MVYCGDLISLVAIQSAVRKIWVDIAVCLECSNDITITGNNIITNDCKVIDKSSGVRNLKSASVYRNHSSPISSIIENTVYFILGISIFYFSL